MIALRGEDKALSERLWFLLSLDLSQHFIFELPYLPSAFLWISLPVREQEVELRVEWVVRLRHKSLSRPYQPLFGR
jgi:hypothetical protein